MSINKVILIGNVGKDPEFRQTDKATVVKFSIATSEKYKDKPEVTQWHNCIAFSQTADVINRHVKKGDRVYVEGKLQYGSYDKDGQKHHTTEIIVNTIQFLGGKKNDEIEL